ncbi:MAG: type II toxin-antitoxin system HicA family toxin [Actinomycetota bacterium]|nr:type II toxin-antitoxin system HicA family toxin [Actinomycetota bacterium]
MPLPRVTKRRRLIQRFRNQGWEGPIDGPDHPFMKKGKLKVKIPNPHGSDEIHVSPLKKILKQAGMTESEYMSAIK